MGVSSLIILVQGALEARLTLRFLLGICCGLVRGIWEKAKGPRASTENDSFRASRNLRGPGVQHFISSLMDEENDEFRSCI